MLLLCFVEEWCFGKWVFGCVSWGFLSFFLVCLVGIFEVATHFFSCVTLLFRLFVDDS